MSSRTKEEARLLPASRPLSEATMSADIPERLPGNLKPLKGDAFPVSALRSATKEWVEREVAKWLSVAFLTLNYKPTLWSNAGQLVRLDEQTAGSEVKKFGNRVDRAVHGNLVRRFNRRVPRIPFLEYGQDRGWHCHVLMEVPAGMADVRFNRIVKDAWSKSPWSLDLDNRQGDEKAAGYLAKYRSKSEMEAWSDTIILGATVLRTK